MRVGVLFVTLDTAQLLVAAFAVARRLNLSETGIVQTLGERLHVVEKLMSPSAKRFVHPETVAHRFARLLPLAGVILRQPHPIEIRRRQSQHAVRRQRATTLAKETLRVVEREMLDKGVGKDKLEILEGQAPAAVDDFVDPSVWLVVDADPARKHLRTASDMQFAFAHVRGGRRFQYFVLGPFPALGGKIPGSA